MEPDANRERSESRVRRAWETGLAFAFSPRPEPAAASASSVPKTNALLISSLRSLTSRSASLAKAWCDPSWSRCLSTQSSETPSSRRRIS